MCSIVCQVIQKRVMRKKSFNMGHIDDFRDCISISYPFKSLGFYKCGKIKHVHAGGSVFLTAGGYTAR